MTFSLEECNKRFIITRNLRDGIVNTTQMCYGQKVSPETPCKVRSHD